MVDDFDRGDLCESTLRMPECWIKQLVRDARAIARYRLVEPAELASAPTPAAWVATAIQSGERLASLAQKARGEGLSSRLLVHGEADADGFACKTCHPG